MSLLRADARHIPLADRCVQCVVTSPPYWGLRDYGVGGQIGLEQTPDAYVAELVAVFREVWRVLRDDGVLWLNLGDSYAANAATAKGKTDFESYRGSDTPTLNKAHQGRLAYRGDGIKAKDLIGIPWRVAFALQADGWYLRSDIIWAKPNPMPESVTDRPTKAHEYVFLLSKSERYFYDAKAIKEELSDSTIARNLQQRTDLSRYFEQRDGDARGRHRLGASGIPPSGTRNARTVWTIATQPYSGAHFATMPEALVERCVLAGSKPRDLVLDPFGGSGTTARVALSLGRRAVCADINPAYLDLADVRTFVTLGLPLECEVPA